MVHCHCEPYSILVCLYIHILETLVWIFPRAFSASLYTPADHFEGRHRPQIVDIHLRTDLRTVSLPRVIRIYHAQYLNFMHRINYTLNFNTNIQMYQTRNNHKNKVWEKGLH